jgi:HEAT repeat protein
VRKEAIENLRLFVNDAEVETRLWQLLKDPNADVRREAEQALRHGPISETRAAALRQRALDPQSPFDERLTAMRALRDANVNAPEVTSALVELAKTAQDPHERAKLFRALDGSDDPALMLPLVNGLQDPNPVVREEAADALSELAKKEPAIQQWLRYIAENDADPRVRREAFRALGNRSN